jgi:hypothetical protein
MTTTLNATTSNGLVVTPDNSGNIVLQYNGVAAPAFAAYNSSTTSVTSGAWAKVTYDTEIFDTNNNFSSSRFTPTVAGYYYITATYRYNGTFSAGNSPANIYKNGSAYCLGAGTAASSYGYTSVSTVMYFNGTTDYAEIYAYQDSGSTKTIASDPNTIFSGCLLRGA